MCVSVCVSFVEARLGWSFHSTTSPPAFPWIQIITTGQDRVGPQPPGPGSAGPHDATPTLEALCKARPKKTPSSGSRRTRGPWVLLKPHQNGPDPTWILSSLFCVEFREVWDQWCKSLVPRAGRRCTVLPSSATPPDVQSPPRLPPS